MNRARELVTTVRTSLPLTEKLADHCKALGIGRTTLQLDVVTRWSSFFYMIESLLVMREPLHGLYRDLRRMPPQTLTAGERHYMQLYQGASENDWEILDDAALCLRIFAVLSTFSEGEVSTCSH